jgi:hypothetical protein
MDVNAVASGSGLAGVAGNEPPADAEQGGLWSVYQDEHVRVVSDEPLDPAAGKALSDRIEKAYSWDEGQQHWKQPGPLGSQLTVAVLSRPVFSALTGDPTGSVAGVTTGPNLFVVPDSVIGRKSAMDDETIAHELGHVQDFREGGKGLQQVPIYLQEGKEYCLGERYPLSEKMANPHIQYVANELGKITGKDAQRVMTQFRTPQDEAGSGNFGFIGETTGALFVEYLRTRLGGKGVPDALPRVANVIAQVGSGSSYAAAFKGQFGVSPTQAESDFVRYIHQTEGNPTARLAGTLFAQKPAASS